jgi:hypothetical protein
MAAEPVSAKLDDADSDDDRLPVSLMQLTALATAQDPVAAVRDLAKNKSAEAAKLVELQDKTRARRPDRTWECASAVEYCAAWHPTRGELWLKVGIRKGMLTVDMHSEYQLGNVCIGRFAEKVESRCHMMTKRKSKVVAYIDRDIFFIQYLCLIFTYLISLVLAMCMRRVY